MGVEEVRKEASEMTPDSALRNGMALSLNMVCQLLEHRPPL